MIFSEFLTMQIFTSVRYMYAGVYFSFIFSLLLI
nr:MAG TPA: hypothetical protein [Caudoviricetes sp.]